MGIMYALLLVALLQGVEWVTTAGETGDDAGQSLAETLYLTLTATGGLFVVGLLLATEWVDLILPYATAAALIATVTAPDHSWRVLAGTVAAGLGIAAAYRTRRAMQKLEAELLAAGLRR